MALKLFNCLAINEGQLPGGGWWREYVLSGLIYSSITLTFGHYFTAPNYIYQHCTLVHYTPQYNNELQFIKFYCTALHCINSPVLN